MCVEGEAYTPATGGSNPPPLICRAFLGWNPVDETGFSRLWGRLADILVTNSAPGDGPRRTETPQMAQNRAAPSITPCYYFKS